MENTKEGGSPYSHRSKREIMNLFFSIMSNRSLSIMAQILKNIVVMKPLYKVPFERNSDRVNVLRREWGGVRFVH